MYRSIRPSTQSWCVAASFVVVLQAGCTSALTASYLRDGLWERGEHAAKSAGDTESVDSAPHAPAAPAPAAEAAIDPEADRERRKAALEEAMARLSRIGALDPAVETALVATLQRTQPEDWPVVVDEFAASLTSTPPASAASAAPAHVAPPVHPESSAPDPQPLTADAEPPAETTADQPNVEPAAEPAPPALAVRSACFASAVRAWGEVERFTADRFTPGQEVIVYVELDNLAANESPGGHTTCIDAALRLVDDQDRTLHTWTFDPVAETSTGRRHDYFARYIVRIPDSVPTGGCRVEMAVTDTLAGSTAMTTLPLEIAAAD